MGQEFQIGHLLQQKWRLGIKVDSKKIGNDLSAPCPKKLGGARLYYDCLKYLTRIIFKFCYHHNVFIVLNISIAVKKCHLFRGRMFAVGLSQGPPHHYWYLWLDKLIPRKDIRGVLLKILLDQVY